MLTGPPLVAFTPMFVPIIVPVGSRASESVEYDGKQVQVDAIYLSFAMSFPLTGSRVTIS